MATTNYVCKICKLSETNELHFGKWKTSDGYTVHHFCALLSSRLSQNGSDNEGIEGFLVEDIRALVKGHTKTKCYYCNKTSATVNCQHNGCFRSFHVKCGMEHKCLFMFDDTFPSYCHLHAGTLITEKYGLHGAHWSCQICLEPMGEYNAITSIPSCCDQGYFHKKCAQEHALTAGYLTKCPCCGNKTSKDGIEYREFIKRRGIFVPDEDAAWEKGEKPFESLLYKHNRCDITDCLCPHGPEHTKTSGKWRLQLCYGCGSKGIHRGCLQSGSTTFLCNDCHTKTLSKVDMDIDHADQNPSSDDVNNNNNKKRPPYMRPEVDYLQNKRAPKLAKVEELTHRESTIVLYKQPTGPDVLNKENRDAMRNERLKMFFDTAKWDVKPAPPPWLI